jgi:hypothetical protein
VAYFGVSRVAMNYDYTISEDWIKIQNNDKQN